MKKNLGSTISCHGSFKDLGHGTGILHRRAPVSDIQCTYTQWSEISPCLGRC
jgi:hypothetical protein